MADDKSMRAPGDAQRINLSEDYEVSYWAKKFGVTKERLQQAVRAAGASVNAVEKELKRQ